MKESLAALNRPEVSPEFDFRLKASIRMESTRLRSPFYRVRLMFRENMVSIAIIPAAAVLILAAFLYTGLPGLFRSPVKDPFAPRMELYSRASLAPAESLSTDVHYMLESAELSEEGVKTLSPGHLGDPAVDTHTISLLSF